MTPTLLIVLNLFTIAEFSESDSGLELRFVEGGRATLSAADQEDRDYYRSLAEWSRGRQLPIAVDLSDERTALSIQRADSDVVAQLQDARGNVEVFMQRHDGVYSLSRDHPSFERIYEILRRSQTEQTVFWFAARHPRLEIEDARPVATQR